MRRSCWLIPVVVTIGCWTGGPEGARPRREVTLRGRDRVIPVDISVEKVGGKDEWKVVLGQEVRGTPTDSTVTSGELDIVVRDGSKRVLYRLSGDDPRVLYVDDPPKSGRKVTGQAGTFRVFIPADRALRTLHLKGRGTLLGLDTTFLIGGHAPRGVALQVAPTIPVGVTP